MQLRLNYLIGKTQFQRCQICLFLGNAKKFVKVGDECYTSSTSEELGENKAYEKKPSMNNKEPQVSEYV